VKAGDCPNSHSLTDHELMKAQVEALFTHDAGGRILRTNEPRSMPAPRFFLGRTGCGNVWRVRQDLPPRIARALENRAAAEPVAEDLDAPPLQVERYCALLREHGEIQSIFAGAAFRFPEIILPPEQVVKISPANSILLVRGFGPAAGELQGRFPWFAVVEDGVAVSVCFSARITTRVAEAGVQTLEPFRGRGYAARAVAGWARAVRERGRIPLYSTSWENTASRAVARKLGLILYGADFSIR
jgi:hypothetical protein